MILATVADGKLGEPRTDPGVDLRKQSITIV
jgi:hypothetical protein